MKKYDYPGNKLKKWGSESMDRARWVWDNVESIISADHLRKITDNAVDRIIEITIGKRSFFGWSGGKDSFVVADLCARAGVNIGQQVLCQPELEFDCLEKFYNENRPEGVFVARTRQNLNWLSYIEDLTKIKMLFSDTSEASRHWLSPKWRAHKVYALRNGMEVFIVGRRRIDGNMVGVNGVQVGKVTGITTLNIIHDWSHEEVFAFYKGAGYPEPPYVRWPKGFQFGNEPWGHRHYGETEKESWDVVLGIEPGLIKYKKQLGKRSKKCLANGNKTLSR